jgi:hypothetical protein
MLRKYVLMLLFVFQAVFVLGQTETPVDSVEVQSMENRAAILSRMTDDLGLSADQQAAVMEVLVVRSHGLRQLPESSGRATALADINTEAINSLQGILTTAQMSKYYQLRQELITMREEYGVQFIDEELDF